MPGGDAQDLRHLPETAGRAGKRSGAGRLAGGETAWIHVRVGASAGKIPGARLARICQAADGESAGGSLAGYRVRTARRRLCAIRAGGERSPDQAGYPVDWEVPEGVTRGRGDTGTRGLATGGSGLSGRKGERARGRTTTRD